MQNESLSINDIVTSHAEKQQQENSSDTGSQQQQNEGGSDAEKAAAETERLANEAKEKGNEALNSLLKELEIENVDELKQRLQKKVEDKELTPEEKEKAENVYKANLQKYAVESGEMKLEDFHQLDTVKSKKDAELVFEKYLENWKEENPDVEENVEDAAKADFELEYKLNSNNEKAKQRGVDRLAKDAKEIRTPLEESYNKVKESFDEEAEVRVTFPKFVKSLDKISAEVVPSKVEWFKGKDGEEDVSIEVDLSEEDRKEILDKVTKRVQNPSTYQLFVGGKEDEIKSMVSEYADALVQKKVMENGNKKIAEMFLGRGIAKGSTTGAKNSFAVNQSKGTSHENDKASRTDNEQTVIQQFGNKK